MPSTSIMAARVSSGSSEEAAGAVVRGKKRRRGTSKKVKSGRSQYVSHKTFKIDRSMDARMHIFKFY
jgi:hypothetical protein